MSKKHVGIIQHPQASVCTLLMRTEREHITSGHGPIDGKTGKRSNNAAAPWHKPADLREEREPFPAAAFFQAKPATLVWYFKVYREEKLAYDLPCLAILELTHSPKTRGTPIPT